MDENSSSDNTSPSYYVYQQGKRSSRPHRGPVYNNAGTSSHLGYGQQIPLHAQAQPYPSQDIGSSYYEGGSMPFTGGDSMNPTTSSQVYQAYGGGGNYQYESSNICGGPGDMPGYGSTAISHQSGPASSDMYGARRRGKFRRQAIRLPDAPPLKQQCRRRLPTPEPDILERVYIRRIPCKIIEEIIEEPMTPPPRVVEKFINQPPKQNRYVRRIVKVPPRSGFGMYGGSAGSTLGGGQGAYGAGYTPGHGIGGVGGSSYGYMDKNYMGDGTSSTYDGGSYSSVPQQMMPTMPSMDYGSAGGIPGYGMQVGSNIMHSSFGNMPSASLSGSAYYGGGQMGNSFSSGGAGYDCYPMSGGQQYQGGYPGYGGAPEMMPPSVGSGAIPNLTYQPSQQYYPPSSGTANNLNYYNGAPPNLICNLRGNGGPGCPFNLCCYPASGPPPMGPSVGSGGYPSTGGMEYPMTVPSGPVYGGMPPQIDGGYMPSSTGRLQYPSGNGGFICQQMGSNRFEPNQFGTNGLTAYPTYGGNQTMQPGGFGGMPMDYGSGMGMYGGNSGMFGQPYSSGSSSFGNFSNYGGSSQPSLHDFNQYGGSYGGMTGGNSSAYGCPPQDCGGRVFRQIIAMPEPPAEPIFSRQRLPTPPPDVYERILVCRPPRKVMYNIVEQPTCPPPIVKNQYVMANPQPPSVMNQCVQVPPKSYQSQCVSMGSSGLGAYGGQCYGGGMMNNCCPMMGGSPCSMMGGSCMSCTCMPCQVFGMGDDYYGGYPSYPGYDYGSGYPSYGGGYPSYGGGYPSYGGGYPGYGGGYPGYGGGYPGYGGGYTNYGGGGMMGYPGMGGYPGGFDGGFGGLGGYGGGYGGYGGGYGY